MWRNRVLYSLHGCKDWCADDCTLCEVYFKLIFLTLSRTKPTTFQFRRKKKKESKRKRKEQEKEEKRKAKLARAAANSDYSLRDLENIGDKKLRDAIRYSVRVTLMAS